MHHKPESELCLQLSLSDSRAVAVCQVNLEKKKNQNRLAPMRAVLQTAWWLMRISMQINRRGSGRHDGPLCVLCFFAYSHIFKLKAHYGFVTSVRLSRQSVSRFEPDLERWFLMTQAHPSHYKYHYFYYCRLIGSVPTFVFLFFCLPTYSLKIKMFNPVPTDSITNTEQRILFFFFMLQK